MATSAPQQECREITPALLSTSATAQVVRLLAGRPVEQVRLRRRRRLLQRLQPLPQLQPRLHQQLLTRLRQPLPLQPQLLQRQRRQPRLQPPQRPQLLRRQRLRQPLPHDLRLRQGRARHQGLGRLRRRARNPSDQHGVERVVLNALAKSVRLRLPDICAFGA